MLAASLKALALFLFALLGTFVFLKITLPPMNEDDRARLKIPKSFDDLKLLNSVLQGLKERNYFRTMASFSVVYLFLQAFSIPGSMYLSILAGALYGVLVALPLVCFCVSTGALLCYFISSLLGPALLTTEKWRNRLETWRQRIDAQGDNLFSYLIVLRIAPLPPHWVVNLLAPHLGISIPKFYFSTFIGISGVTYIHTSIGTALDQMTSSDDFHLISLGNCAILAGICVAVLVPVLLRRRFSKELAVAAESSDEPHYSDTTPAETFGSPSSSATCVADDTELLTAVRLDGAEIARKVVEPFSIEDEDEDDSDRATTKTGRTSDTRNKASKILGVDLSKEDLP